MKWSFGWTLSMLSSFVEKKDVHFKRFLLTKICFSKVWCWIFLSVQIILQNSSIYQTTCSNNLFFTALHLLISFSLTLWNASTKLNSIFLITIQCMNFSSQSLLKNLYNSFEVAHCLEENKLKLIIDWLCIQASRSPHKKIIKFKFRLPHLNLKCGLQDNCICKFHMNCLDLIG